MSNCKIGEARVCFEDPYENFDSIFATINEKMINEKVYIEHFYADFCDITNACSSLGEKIP